LALALKEQIRWSIEKKLLKKEISVEELRRGKVKIKRRNSFHLLPIHALLKKPLEPIPVKPESPFRRKKKNLKQKPLDPDHFIIRDLFGIKEYNFYRLNQFEKTEG